MRDYSNAILKRIAQASRKRKALSLMKEKSFMAYVLQCTREEFRFLTLEDILPLLDPRTKENRIHNYWRHFAFSPLASGVIFPCILPQQPNCFWIHVGLHSLSDSLLLTPVFLKMVEKNLYEEKTEGVFGHILGIQLQPYLEKEENFSKGTILSCFENRKGERKTTEISFLQLNLKDKEKDHLEELLQFLLDKERTDEEKIRCLKQLGIPNPESYRIFRSYRKAQKRKHPQGYFTTEGSACYLYERASYGIEKKEEGQKESLGHGIVTSQKTKDE